MSKSMATIKQLTFSEYAEKASRTDRFTQTDDSLQILKFGFFGEVGGLLSALKKVSRDSLQVSESELAGEELRGRPLVPFGGCEATRTAKWCRCDCSYA